MVQNQRPTYVDLFYKSYVEAQNRGRQEAQEENERRMRELQEKVKREREQALRDAQESAKCDDEKQRRILDHQRRSREERERQIREEKDFCELRKALMNYDFQEFPRIKKESFRDLYVGDIDLIRIALIGPAGSGKTSFAGKNNFVLRENLEYNAAGNV